MKKTVILFLSAIFTSGSAWATLEYQGQYTLHTGPQNCAANIEIFAEDDRVDIYIIPGSGIPRVSFKKINDGTKSYTHDWSKYCYENVYDGQSLAQYMSGEVSPFAICAFVSKELQTYIQFQDQLLEVYNLSIKRNTCYYSKLSNTNSGY